MPEKFPKLWNPEKVKLEDLIYLLENGAEKEPIKVLEEFAKWTMKNELKIYKIGLDCIKNLEKITIPMAIIFGDQDIFANITTTKSVYRRASSEYLLWRPVRGNSHIELTMGADIKQISFDIKNLMEYAIKHNR
jgi:esterase/lipase